MQASGKSLINSTPSLTRSIGRSVENREILLFTSSGTTPNPGGVLLIGGMHGDERATVLLLQSFVERYLRSGPLASRNILVIPVANPDGYEHNGRYNANGVDLNRNFETNWTHSSVEPSGAGPWSEPESRALRDLIVQEQPSAVISLHWALGEIDADGMHSTPLARAMWDAMDAVERAPYRVRTWEDAPGAGFTFDLCPGSLGQWCGYQLRYPDGTSPAMITLELPYDPQVPRPARLPDSHLEMLRHTWTTAAPAYMAAVESGVFKMLAAACG